MSTEGDLTNEFHNERAIAPEAAQAGLPPLIGQPDEVKEAKTIRLAILEKADDILSQMRSDVIETASQQDTAVVPPQQVTYAQMKAAEAALHRLRHQAEARWWLDHRDRAAGELISQFLA